MSVRKLLLFFFACALMVPVSGAGQAAKSAADKRLFERLTRPAVHSIPMPPVPISTTRAVGFDVSSPDGKNTTGEGRRTDAIRCLVALGLREEMPGSAYRP